MYRILLAIALSLPAAVAWAGIPSLSDNNHIDCPKSAKANGAVPASVPVPVAKSGASVVLDHAGTGAPLRSTAPRMISPRWHSFLPGMFR